MDGPRCPWRFWQRVFTQLLLWEKRQDSKITLVPVPLQRESNTIMSSYFRDDSDWKTLCGSDLPNEEGKEGEEPNQAQDHKVSFGWSGEDTEPRQGVFWQSRRTYHHTEVLRLNDLVNLDLTEVKECKWPVEMAWLLDTEARKSLESIAATSHEFCASTKTSQEVQDTGLKKDLVALVIVWLKRLFVVRPWYGSEDLFFGSTFHGLLMTDPSSEYKISEPLR